MNLRRKFRIAVKFLWFGGVVFWAMVDFWIRIAFRKNSLPARSLWLQRHSRRILKIFKLEPKVSGTVPSHGLLITNHLSYLDVIVLSAITPAVFVAKMEIKSWPVMGLCAQMGGTLFVDRTRKMHVGEMGDEIQSALDSGVLVGLFPEGTSTNGQEVLPFRSALLEPATRRSHPICVAYLQYTLGDGDAADEICYWGDHTFFPHMLNMMSKQAVGATVHFAPFDSGVYDRKEMATKLREEILKLRDGLKAAKTGVA